MNQDVYPTFAALAQAERYGRDYRIRIQRTPGSSTTIIAPHAGGIEKKTSRIARAIAGRDFNFYLFEGIKHSGNKSLHIKSHRFDEQRCLSLLAKSRRVITIHGCKGRNQVIYLGGLDYELKAVLAGGLKTAGYSAKTRFHKFPAIDPRNICNRGITGKGVQLELSYGLRLNGNIDRLVFTIGRILRETPVT